MQEARIFVCNRPTQGGGFKRQLDKVLAAMRGKACFLLRASEFPPNRKNQTAQAYRKFREAGGRSVMVPIPEWERMMMVREFHARHRRDVGFAAWMEQAKLLSGLVLMVHLLRLDLLGRRYRASMATSCLHSPCSRVEPTQALRRILRPGRAQGLPAASYMGGSALADWTGWGSAATGRRGRAAAVGHPGRKRVGLEHPRRP